MANKGSGVERMNEVSWGSEGRMQEWEKRTYTNEWQIINNKHMYRIEIFVKIKIVRCIISAQREIALYKINK